jgi:hypothetical protein
MNVNNQEIWFSHIVNKYELEEIGAFKKAKKTNKQIRLDWDKCTLEVIGRLPDNKIRIVLRSKSTKNSGYRAGTDLTLRYMMGIDISNISPPKIEKYNLSEDNSKVRENFDKEKIQPKNNQRVVFGLDDKYWIWDWVNGRDDLKTTKIYKNYEYILSEIKSAKLFEKGLFHIELEDEEIDKERIKMSNIFPIIYQPAIDSLKNFVRQVHCAEIDSNTLEITIIFNNEHLRQHRILNDFYQGIRNLIYHRIEDVETFRIYNNNTLRDIDKNQFIFENIYSDDFDIESDSIHGDPRVAPHREIKYTTDKYNNPVIFINTSNHAMAEKDNNHDIWKWEYIPYLKKSIDFGTKPRAEINEAFNSKTYREKSIFTNKFKYLLFQLKRLLSLLKIM